MKYQVITLTLTVCFFSALAFGGDTLTLDSSTSSARFFQGSKASPDSVNTGVASVTGRVNLDTNDPDDSVFDLSVYPADEGWGNALTSDRILPTSYVPDDRSDSADVQVDAHYEDRERQAGSHRGTYIDSRGTHRRGDAD
jgi:polyisoprenoid-binding protein YceI